MGFSQLLNAENVNAQVLVSSLRSGSSCSCCPCGTWGQFFSAMRDRLHSHILTLHYAIRCVRSPNGVVYMAQLLSSPIRLCERMCLGSERRCWWVSKASADPRTLTCNCPAPLRDTVKGFCLNRRGINDTFSVSPTQCPPVPFFWRSDNWASGWELHMVPATQPPPVRAESSLKILLVNEL